LNSNFPTNYIGYLNSFIAFYFSLLFLNNSNIATCVGRTELSRTKITQVFRVFDMSVYRFQKVQPHFNQYTHITVDNTIPQKVYSYITIECFKRFIVMLQQGQTKVK